MKRKDDSLKLFNLPFITGVDVISGKNIIGDFRRHIHKTFIIGIVTEGERIINHSCGNEKIAKNEMFIINPGQVHSCHSQNAEHSYKVLSVPYQTMYSIASEISGKKEIVPFFDNFHYKNEKLTNKILELFRVIMKEEPDFQIRSDLYAFLACLLKNFSSVLPQVYSIADRKDSIKRACDYICQNYPENISLEKLSVIACLSPFHFQREFKKRVGITPHEYLNDVKISKSLKLLPDSADICDVANGLGFFDQSHFSRIFKKTVGVSPGKYIRTN